MQTAMTLVADSFSLDNSKTTMKHIQAGQEPVIPSILKTMSVLNQKPEGYTAEDIFDLNVAKAEYKAVWNNVFVDNQLDAIVCPGAPHTAVPHDEFGTPPYTAVWNLVEVSGADTTSVVND